MRFVSPATRFAETGRKDAQVCWKRLEHLWLLVIPGFVIGWRGRRGSDFFPRWLLSLTLRLLLVPFPLVVLLVLPFAALLAFDESVKLVSLLLSRMQPDLVHPVKEFLPRHFLLLLLLSILIVLRRGRRTKLIVLSLDECRRTRIERVNGKVNVRNIGRIFVTLEWMLRLNVVARAYTVRGVRD